MAPTTCSFSIRSALQLALLSIGTLLPIGAHAEGPPIYLWGFQKGCQQDRTLDRHVEKRLHDEGVNIGLLSSPDGNAAPACAGDNCIKFFKNACGKTEGKVLGGQYSKTDKVIRTRLWLHDLATGQTITQEDYCETQSCNLHSALPAQARALIEARSPQEIPTLRCGQDALASQPPQGPVFLAVTGSGPAPRRTALQTALSGQLSALGRQVQSIPSDVNLADSDSLKSLVAGKPGARVLLAELQGKRATLRILDERTSRQPVAKEAGCPAGTACSEEQLISFVKDASSALLEACLGPRCAAFFTGPPPAEVCAPLPEACTSPQLAITGDSGGGNLSGRHIDPSTANLVKGSLWGLFGAGVVTAGALFIANSQSGTYVDPQGLAIQNSLWRPAWTAAGISIGLFGIALPVTLIIKSAEKNAAAAPRPSSSSAQNPIQCPN